MKKNITKMTRRESYAQIIPHRQNRKDQIKAVLIAGDPAGMTAEEIVTSLSEQKRIPIDMNYVRPRLTEMKQSGEVEVVDQRRSKSGRKTAVWKVVYK